MADRCCVVTPASHVSLPFSISPLLLTFTYFCQAVSLVARFPGFFTLLAIIEFCTSAKKYGFTQQTFENSFAAITLLISASFICLIFIKMAPEDAGTIIVEFFSALASIFIGIISFTFGYIVFGRLAILLTFLSMVEGAFIFAQNYIHFSFFYVTCIFSGFCAAIFVGLIAIKTLKGDCQFVLISEISTLLGAIGGTSFQNASLTNAIFSRATLGNCSFINAELRGTLWERTEKIEFASVGNTYLKNVNVRKLLTTNCGLNQIYDGLNLAGVNLRKVNLTDASLVGTNLNFVNLQNANLSRTVLKQTQFDAADLSGAILTGAYIEDWGITSDTKLDGIRCEYVYMRLPTKDDPDPIRKPDNRNEVFKDGDFADFIRPLTDTLDLYHNQGVDPRAIAIAFKDLAESHPDAELEIVAMEKKGRDKFLLRAKTTTTADKSELSAEYFSTYNQIKDLSEAQVRALLGEKDSRIQSLEVMVVTALQRPNFYSHIERTDSVSNNPGGISQSVSGGNVYGGMQAAQGDGNVQSQEIHSIASSEQGLTQAQVIELFAQLESVLRQPELPGEVQAKAAKYLDAAKEEVTAKEPDKQLAAGNLKRMAETIESTSKTMESSKKIWETTKPILEAVLPWLGVAKGFFGF